MGVRGSISGKGMDFFSSPPRLDRLCSPQCEKWALSPGVERPGRELYHSYPSKADVKNVWSYTSTPPYVFKAVFILSTGTNLLLAALRTGRFTPRGNRRPYSLNMRLGGPQSKYRWQKEKPSNKDLWSLLNTIICPFKFSKSQNLRLNVTFLCCRKRNYRPLPP
jgi:hypothetical protein